MLTQLSKRAALSKKKYNNKVAPVSEKLGLSMFMRQPSSIIQTVIAISCGAISIHYIV
jgi:hypothetical protein